MPERMILTNRYYRHFKGKLYFVLCIATHSETGERLVVYKQCYGDHEFYVRPYDMFASKVDRAKYPNADQEYRFELVNYPPPKGGELLVFASTELLVRTSNNLLIE